MLAGGLSAIREREEVLDSERGGRMMGVCAEESCELGKGCGGEQGCVVCNRIAGGGERRGCIRGGMSRTPVRYFFF
jgi:hypothetical protein